MGSKFRRIRSMPADIESNGENEFDRFASTSANTLETMFPNCSYGVRSAAQDSGLTVCHFDSAVSSRSKA
jgi:hypothetical protein